MKEFEIFVSAAYESAGSVYHNAFKVYVLAPTAEAAKESARLRLADENYIDVELDEPIAIEE